MSAATEVREDRSYTRDHEWARLQDEEVLVGITAFAVEQLGDITLVNLDVAVGTMIEAGKAFGTIESVKTLSDLYAPVSGKVVRVNTLLDDGPETINDDCWDEGWMVAIEPNRWDEESKSLLSPDAYRQHLAEVDH
jgi:glycine cleavage system H protein